MFAFKLPNFLWCQVNANTGEEEANTRPGDSAKLSACVRACVRARGWERERGRAHKHAEKSGNHTRTNTH